MNKYIAQIYIIFNNINLFFINFTNFLNKEEKNFFVYTYKYT